MIDNQHWEPLDENKLKIEAYSTEVLRLIAEMQDNCELDSEKKYYLGQAKNYLLNIVKCNK